MTSYEQRTIGVFRRLFRSSIPGYLTLLFGLTSIALVFGYASSSPSS